jgi:hypothetical protein
MDGVDGWLTHMDLEPSVCTPTFLVTLASQPLISRKMPAPFRLSDGTLVLVYCRLSLGAKPLLGAY